MAGGGENIHVSGLIDRYTTNAVNLRRITAFPHQIYCTRQIYEFLYTASAMRLNCFSFAESGSMKNRRLKEGGMVEIKKNKAATSLSILQKWPRSRGVGVRCGEDEGNERTLAGLPYACSKLIIKIKLGLGLGMSVGIFRANRGEIITVAWDWGAASPRAALAASTRAGRSREEAIQDTMGSDIAEGRMRWLRGEAENTANTHLSFFAVFEMGILAMMRTLR